MTTTRRRLHEPYFIIWEIRAGWTVQKVIETNSPFDDAHFAAGNYYADHAEASEVLGRRLAAERAERRRLAAERRRIQRATEEWKARCREYQRRHAAKKKKLREQRATLSAQKGGDA